MRREKWIGILSAVLLAFCLSLAGIGCVATAMGLNVHIPWAAAWCMVCVLVWCASYQKPVLAMAGFALTAALLCWQGTLVEAVQASIHQISRVYHSAWGWRIYTAPMPSPENVDMTGAMGVFSVLTGGLTVRCVLYRRSTALAVGAGMLPLALCLLGKSVQPGALWLFLLLAAVGMLVLTQWVRRKSRKQANRLTAMALIPVLLVTGALFWLFPQEKFQQRDLKQQITQFFEGAFGERGKPVSADGGAVDLSRVGKRREHTDPVFTVTAPKDGLLYLRACAYDTYYRNTWTNLAVECDLPWPSGSLLTYEGQVEVETNRALNMLLVPYYAGDGVPADMTRGVANYTKKTVYAYPQYSLPKQWTALESGDMPDDTMTQLPTVTYAWAQHVLKNLLEDGQSVYARAQTIRDFVSKSAKYSLSPDKMDADAQDFAKWFVEESGKGYCVHFATAATVLLRAAGIPARYVTGYAVRVKQAEATRVYGDNAHAWTEYYLPGVGWVILEATPAAQLSAQTQAKGAGKWLQGLKTVGMYALVILAVLLTVGVPAQWAVRVWLRRRKRIRGSVNARALAIWSQLAQAYRLLDKTPEQALYTLAERAKFSASGVTGQELEQLQNALQDALRQLKCHNLRHRMKYTIILAIY